MPRDARFEEIAIGICESKSFAKPSFIRDGAFKEAYFTKTSGDLPVALKVFDPNKCNLCRAEREIASMKQCESPFIGKLHDWGTFKDKDKGSFLFVIEEYIDGGTLTDRLGSTCHSAIHICDYGIALLDRGSFLFVIEEYIDGGTLTDRLGSTCHSAIHICDYGIALLNAVSHLREKSLVHRDIKPDNIMFRSDDDVPILVDFGLVRDLSGVSLTQTYLQQGPGTPFFASPEQLNNDKYLIDWRSDQFSIGVVLGICLTGNHPYQQPGQTDLQTVNQVITRATCSSEFSCKANEAGYGFLTKMVLPWPVDRFARPDLIIREFENLK
jgi:serine/threonine protein kinase